ncbi:glycerate kinase [Mesorhizobium sp. ZC-5]|uniref:glycerate kinase type-2 family protein n=1 Tax=Mesorhizobium sp. ZC-5 TaxID=2986066 RepID=UPI0021E77F0F|nr:glycerate kinase [Mesorhizobium sp. ZC-5]MCV3242863.1 glycerate kinase [Mesorhizobium sp. ZC-5]
MFYSALKVASLEGKFANRLPNPPKGRTIVIGAGKASSDMAQAFEEAWNRPCEGLVVTRYGHAVKTRYVEVIEASHPVPDAAGEQAAQRILDLARSAGPDDLVVCMISGGASALLSLPVPGITLADKQALTEVMLRSGAPIGAMNKVRKSLSAIKGGRLAAAALPASIMTYLISDVPGDDPSVIGSGPTIFAAPESDGALEILEEYQIEISPRIRSAILQNRHSNGVGLKNDAHFLATPKMALDAAAAEARKLGVTPLILGDAIEGEAREVATVFAGLARSVIAYGEPVGKPCVLISGGETTVTVKGNGRGGRNAEFLLALMCQLQSQPGTSAIACDTDGIDGSEDNAGAWFDSQALQDPVHMARAYLQNNDAYSYFNLKDRLVITGPTHTNVNDFRAVLIR